MRTASRQRLRLPGGTELSFITAGDSSSPAVLLLHGTPQSARYFRGLVPELSGVAQVIAPDLPGFGESDLLPGATFPAYGDAILELLDRLADRGYVARRPDPADRRAVLVRVTRRGEAVLRRLTRIHREELHTAGPLLLKTLRKLVS